MTLTFGYRENAKPTEFTHYSFYLVVKNVKDKNGTPHHFELYRNTEELQEEPAVKLLKLWEGAHEGMFSCVDQNGDPVLIPKENVEYVHCINITAQKERWAKKRLEQRDAMFKGYEATLACADDDTP